MANPLEQAQKSGMRANDRIGESFARFGTAAHPRGFVLTAYRTAHIALSAALDADNRLQAVNDVTRSLRQTLASGIRGELEDMQVFGQEEATRQLRYYGVTPSSELTTGIERRTQLDGAVQSVLARFDAQASLASALVITGASDAQIAGDDQRGGILLPSVVLAACVFWAASLTWNSFAMTATAQSSYQFKKQAIAGLDERTTDCCLRVHGQIQPLDGVFKLTGTPRYADEMDWPAFHYYCRTSGTLYLPEFDDGLTERMRSGADQIMQEREAGGSGYRHPADAFAG